VPKLVGINHVALEVDDLEEALAFWESIFGPLELRSRIGIFAFIDMGDQFIALAEGRSTSRDHARHFGLVVDDKEAVRARLDELGVRVFGQPGPLPQPGAAGLDFYDPWGNLIQVVDYRDIQFTKTDEVLRAQGLKGLKKSERVREELRTKGIRPK
jgi:catechol 2,3-dioxygenase-like lactoylglutathione lyase family enzyme